MLFFVYGLLSVVLNGGKIMLCPHCNADLKVVVKKGVFVNECGGCGGQWLLKEKFAALRQKEDEFIKWLDLPLWKEDKHHKLSLSSRACPECSSNLYAVDYHGHDITLDICTKCAGVWLDKGELEKIIAYMEDQVTEETLDEFLKDLGHEAARFMKDDKDLISEVKDMSMIMKLLEYRIFSKFPLLSQLASRVPLT